MAIDLLIIHSRLVRPRDRATPISLSVQLGLIRAALGNANNGIFGDRSAKCSWR